MSRYRFGLKLSVIIITLAHFSNLTAQDFDEERLLNNIKILSSDSFEGRGFSLAGNKKAQVYIAEQFKEIGISPAIDNDYIQSLSHTLKGRARQRIYPVQDPGENLIHVPDTIVDGGNVVAKIRGQSEKVIAITAHLDHLGIWRGEIYNGADDNGSGTAALFAIAEYFKDRQPNHTLIFAAVDGEEIGMPGTKYLVDHFPGGLEKVVLNVNMDMIAHNDDNTLYACGTYHYPGLKQPLARIETTLSLLYGHDDPTNKKQDDWTGSSDHRIFHQKGIPFIYFGVEDHRDYHAPTDTYENINPEFYIKAVKLIIQAIEVYDTNLD